MTKRTAYISPGNLGALHAFREVSRIIDDISRKHEAMPPSLDVDTLFGGTMVQSGVDRFLVVDSDHDTVSQSAFIDDMTDTIAPKDMDELYRVMHDVVESQTIRKPANNERGPLPLAGLLVDLVVASRYRTSLVLALPMSDVDAYRPFLRPEFCAALEVFFSGIESTVAAMPVPQITASASDVRRLHSIIKSDLFRDYRDAQLIIDDPKKSLPDNVQRVSSTARELTRGFSDQISLQSLVLSGLSVTGYAIEVFLGKLPATAIAPFKRIFQS